VLGLHAGNDAIKEARPGGLIAVATDLDPALTKGDALVGCLLGRNLPEPRNEIKLKITVLPRVIEAFPETYVENEPLVLGVGTATTLGFVTEQKKKKGVTLALKKPVCVNAAEKIAVMRRAKNRWRLYATAEVIE